MISKNNAMKRKKANAGRPAMPRVSDEMKRWSAMLGAEIAGWPNVCTRPMFGLLGYYRKKAIFAALPVTRAIGTPNAIIFKVEAMTPELLRRAKEDPRIDPERVGPGAKWTSFAVHSEQDLRDAMWWLNQAYERAK
jgi:hypothetical protein